MPSTIRVLPVLFQPRIVSSIPNAVGNDTFCESLLAAGDPENKEGGALPTPRRYRQLPSSRLVTPDQPGSQGDLIHPSIGMGACFAMGHSNCRWSKPSHNLSTATTFADNRRWVATSNQSNEWRHKPSSPLAARGSWLSAREGEFLAAKLGFPSGKLEWGRINSKL
jgi:hypothetical protein